MKKKEIKNTINKFWNLAIKSMHETSPENRNLPTTSGQVEDALDTLYNEHRKNQLELFEGLFKIEEKLK